MLKPFTISRFNWIPHFYNLHIIINVKLILSSIFNGWLFWSINHILISLNSDQNVFKKIWFVGKICNKLPNGLFGTNMYKALDSCWLSLLTTSQWTNSTSVISRCGTFSPFLSFVILFSALPSSFIVSDVKSSRLYPSLILNVTLFSILFTYISTDGLLIFLHDFLKYTQNSLEYLIQNTIHQLVQIYHSMSAQIF